MATVILKQCETYETEALIQVLDEGIRQLTAAEAEEGGGADRMVDAAPDRAADRNAEAAPDRAADHDSGGAPAATGWAAFVRPGDKVLLKVNLISPMASETAAVTHSEFVRALVRILRREGCVVWIGDSSGGAMLGKAPTDAAFERSGLAAVAREEGATILNFDRAGAVPVTPKSGIEPAMYLARPMFDADVVINLPKLKTHMMGMYTGAVKNVFGCIPGLKKAEYHRLAPDPAAFGEVLADIHEAGRFHLHIMDGILAMQGEGPVAGEPYQANKVLFSRDPLALDLVAVKMIGLDPDALPILDAAKRRGIGAAALSQVRLAGDFPTPPRLERFAVPFLIKAGVLQGRRTAIFKLIVPFIDLMKKRPRIDREKCRHCNSCVDSCPVAAIDRSTKRIDYSLCIECLCCHELCTYKAVDLVAKFRAR